MMEERYHATTQNQFYPDMSSVNKYYYSGGKMYQPTYVLVIYVVSLPMLSECCPSILVCW